MVDDGKKRRDLTTDLVGEPSTKAASRLAMPSELPSPSTRLVGRERDITSGQALIRRPDVRLLTLTGPGGVGKTRLALAIARAVARNFPDGVWFVPLDSIRDPALVLPTIAGLFGVRESGSHLLTERLGQVLREKCLLLLLDNFEQVISAAPAVAELLAASAGTKVLVTSRETLLLTGEHDMRVTPLPAPDPTIAHPLDAVSSFPAIQLFVQRAASADASFALTSTNAGAVAAICRRLDGLPLAIELAAPRIRLFPPAELLDRLHYRLPLLTRGPRDLPARQQTLRNAIAWSDELLNASERRLFRQLAIFSGGFTLPAAEAVCAVRRRNSEEADSNRVHSPPVIDVVASLVEKSLLQRVRGGERPTRFRMLETIHEYAFELLASGDDHRTIRESHAAWFLAFAEEIEAGWQRPDRQRSLREIEPEHANIRSALSWFEESRNALAMLRLVIALSSFWHHVGHPREGINWLNRAIALGRSEGAPSWHLSMALSWLGRIHAFIGARTLAASVLAEALAIRREMNNTEGIAYSQINLSEFVTEEHEEEARERLEEAVALFRQLGHSAGLSMALQRLGDLAYQHGAYERAASLANEALDVARTSGHALRIADALAGVGQVALANGDRQTTRAAFTEALAISQEIGFTFGIADALVGFAALAGKEGHTERAVRLLAAAAHLRDDLESERMFHEAHYQRTLTSVRRRLSGELFAHDWATGGRLTLADAIEAVDTQVSEVPPAAEDPHLTMREREVLTCLVEGLSNPAIAAALSISPKTVSAHITKILTKLGVESRTAAASRAIRDRLV